MVEVKQANEVIKRLVKLKAESLVSAVADTLTLIETR